MLPRREMFVINNHKYDGIKTLAVVCNKTSALVGNVLTLKGTPGNGPSGTIYTIKFYKKIGTGVDTLIITKTSTGVISISYTVTSGDIGSVQFWSTSEYVCPDGSLKGPTSSGRCTITISSCLIPTCDFELG